MKNQSSQTTFHLISLGCAKNSVDSDSMAQLLERDGYRQVKNKQKADVLIVNTCGFIEPAREEAYRVLNELSRQKRNGQLLIAAGCLTQRFGLLVAQQVPGIDGILGTRRWMDIVDLIKKIRKSQHPNPTYHLPKDAITMGGDEKETLRASVSGRSAYLKIADGCRRPCSFCAIPLIKGTAISRPKSVILAEARKLAEIGIREINLIAQDTTDYGYDLGMRDGLADLLESIATFVPDINWVRILYTYPGYITDRLIEVMARHPQILPYLDIPLQHAHPSILRRMQRPANVEWVYNTISKMREILPSLAIRTTFIVGFPGETETEFNALLDFVNEIRFDRIGVFQYSFEPGTSSEQLGDPIPTEIKEQRYDRLMTFQQGISLQINQSLVGKELDVLIEGYDKGISIGRSYRDAPEIDGLVLVHGKQEKGEIVPIKITGAMAYDLVGVPIS